MFLRMRENAVGGGEKMADGNQMDKEKCVMFLKREIDTKKTGINETMKKKMKKRKKLGINIKKPKT